MIPVPSGVRVSLATGHTDMRKGFPGLAVAYAAEDLEADGCRLTILAVYTVVNVIPSLGVRRWIAVFRPR
jgi:hypothetical protein